jgi:carbamoyltransferase
MEYILGVSYGHHESSVTLLSSNGQITYLREEWLSRVKNDYRFPIFSLNYLKKNFQDLEKNLVSICLFEKPLKNWLGIGVKKNLSIFNYINKLRQFKKSDIYFEKNLKKVFKSLPEVLYCPHHLSHIYTNEFLLNKRDNNAINIIFDGYGEGLSGVIYKGQGKTINLIKKYQTQSSLGLLYSAITEWIGFTPNEDEYKVMALAGYGKPTFNNFIETNIIQFNESSLDLTINDKYFNFIDSGLPTIKNLFVKKFGKYKKELSIIKQKRILNVICSFQNVIEKIIIKLIINIINHNSDTRYIFLGGGLFHNSKLVGEITRKINFPIYVSATPGDAGSSIGAAYFAMLCQNKNFIKIKTHNPYIGPKLEKIGDYGHLFKKISKKNIYSQVEKILNSDEIFATFSGFCELGPRALLSRSLCCNARSKKALNKLNLLIKKRESFRPIAPVFEKKFLIQNFEFNEFSIENSFWMGQVIWPKKLNNPDMPFCHIDSSVRAQVYDKDNTTHKKYIPLVLQNLLKKDYILANTSLNIAGDPMVFMPEDLYINCKRLEIKYIIQNENIYELI